MARFPEESSGHRIRQRTPTVQPVSRIKPCRARKAPCSAREPRRPAAPVELEATVGPPLELPAPPDAACHVMEHAPDVGDGPPFRTGDDLTRRRRSERPDWLARPAPPPRFQRSAVVVMPHGLDHRPAGGLAVATGLDARFLLDRVEPV